MQSVDTVLDSVDLINGEVGSELIGESNTLPPNCLTCNAAGMTSR